MNKFTVIYRVKNGNVYEIPVSGVKHYWQAVRFALGWFGLKLNEVTLCR